MKLIGVKRNFQVLLVPNYCAFQITVIYVKQFPMQPHFYKVYQFSLSYQYYHLTQYLLIIKDFYSDFYKLFFSQDYSGRFRYTNSKTLFHISKFADLFIIIIFHIDNKI